jgi:glycosyltransferase involved in cell wall biosynthesis
MACGTPVIVSDMTGAKDVVRDGTDGFITETLNAQALKQKILHFYTNRDEVERMGRAASVQAQNFTWSRYRQRVRDAITQMTAR